MAFGKYNTFNNVWHSGGPGSAGINAWSKLGICLVLVLMTALCPLSAQDRVEISVRQLSQKWVLDKYQFLGYTEAPSSKEKSDYLLLNADMTFTSISEGEIDQGEWRLNKDNKSISLSNRSDDGELVFIIDSLSEKQLVLIIDDPSDSEAKYFTIHFTVDAYRGKTIKN